VLDSRVFLKVIVLVVTVHVDIIVLVQLDVVLFKSAQIGLLSRGDSLDRI
jgi:hypothetical protein